MSHRSNGGSERKCGFPSKRETQTDKTEIERGGSLHNVSLFLSNPSFKCICDFSFYAFSYSCLQS